MARNYVMSSRSDQLGRTLGVVVFIIGIIILLVAACATYGFFTSDSASASVAANGASSVPITARLTESACGIVKTIIGLVVFAMIGSWIAGRGMQMYFNAAKEESIPLSGLDEDKDS